jgi:hypothetical protein
MPFSESSLAIQPSRYTITDVVATVASYVGAIEDISSVKPVPGFAVIVILGHLNDIFVLGKTRYSVV